MTICGMGPMRKRPEADAGAGYAERFEAFGGIVKRDREAFDLEVAIDARAHEIRLGGVCSYGEEE
jgi:hypothetical protein